MIDHSLLKTQYTGRDGFIWWIGKVAPPAVWRDESTDIQEGWSYRCKVRIIGSHPFDGATLADEDLPWAHVMASPTSGAGQGGLGESSSMVGGETVFGFFLDGEEGQQPVVFGALQRNLHSVENTITKEAIEREKSAGFDTFSAYNQGIPLGPTTLPVSGDSTVATPADNGRTAKKGAAVGGQGDKEGVRRDVQSASQYFGNASLGPHSGSNACENDAISKITHAVGSFLKTINSLQQFGQVYINAAQNFVADVRRIIGKASRLIVGAMKMILNTMRDKIFKFLGKRFRDFVGLVVPEPQKSPVAMALKRIMDILFCILEKLGVNIFDYISGFLKELVNKTIGASVCGVEQAVATMIAKLTDAIDDALKPIMDGLDWLTNALGGIGNLLGKVGGYINMIMSFLSCDNLQCKDYDDWSQGWGLSTKAAGKISSVLDNVQIIKTNNLDISVNDLDAAAGDGKLSFLSLLGGNVSQFFDCNDKTANPTSQDDIPDTIPPGSTFIYCLPPKVKIIGQCDRSAKAIPVISSVDGSILSIELTRRGRGYKFPPKICIIDKTRFGGGAIAEAKIDNKGRVTRIFLLEEGSGYCPDSRGITPINPPQDDPDADPKSLDPNNLQFPNPFINDCDKVARLREKKYKGGPRIELERDFIWVDQKTGRELYCPNFDPQVPTEPGPRPDPDDPEGPELPDITPFVPVRDQEAPYVIFTSPADNTSGIVTSANISITFSEEIVRGTGKIKISELKTNDLFEEIDVENKEQVEFLGGDTIRINPKNDLKSGTEYFVNMTRGTVADGVGNKFAGIAGTETYNFSTREAASPTDPPVGIITGFEPINPGIGYTSGDDATVGICTFRLILSPAGSIIGLEAKNCDHLFDRVPDVELNTTTGTGGRVRPVLAFKPNRTKDTGEGDNISQSLVIRVIDCI
tara:strand:- start:2937 stop:5696 length:2760 start_codon:yes stop_codon:yes gene_type:complete